LASLALSSFYTVMQLFLFLSLGFIMKRFGNWEKAFFQSLSKFLVTIALPVYFITRIGKLEFSGVQQSLIFPIASIAVAAAGLFFSFLLFNTITLSKQNRNTFTALSSFGNSGYIPLALIEIFPITLPEVSNRFGVDAPLLYVGAYLLTQSPLLWTLGNILISGKRSQFKWNDLITPPLIGIILGLFLSFTGIYGSITAPGQPGHYIFMAMERISDVVLPLILISLGAMIGTIPSRKFFSKVLMAIAGRIALIRFLLLPGLFYLCFFTIFKWLNLQPAQIFVLFLETHIPPATNLSVMATHAGINEDTTAYIMLFTYVLYLLLLPVFLFLFMNLIAG